MELLRELYEAVDDLWDHGTVQQEFDSGATSLNQVPSTFKVVDSLHGWVSGSVNADIGGGKAFKVDDVDMHKFTDALRSRGVINVVYDPYNRTSSHNVEAIEKIKDGQSDTTTVNNVLNVIKEPEIRQKVIHQAFNALKPGGTSYFLIYEGNRTGEGKDTGKGRWQNNMSAVHYMPEISHFYRHVTKKGNLIIAKK